MILVDDEIREAIKTGEIELSDFSEECLQPASYDLRVGDEGFVVSIGRVNIRQDGALKIEPGDFGLVITHERLRLPTNIVGRFGLRSAYTRIGLLATVGPQVDPGFEGRLVIGVVNFSSETVRLSHLEPFCTLELERLARHSSIGYHGPYQKQDSLTDEIINKIPKEPYPLAVMLIRQLAAASPSLKHLTEVQKLPRKARHLRVFDQEKEAFERLKPALLEKHRGEYVVIEDGKAVLFGSDKVELAKQAYQRFGYRPLYVGLVREEAEAVHIPTPRLPRRTI